jgi:hypothetical protein
MPPHLHPRSRVTSSLFVTTLLASFVVVGLPHIFPCPVPRTGLADSVVTVDSEGRRIRKRRRNLDDSSASEESQGCMQVGTTGGDKEDTGMTIEEEARILEMRARECPVPKPGGLVGEFLGFKNNKSPESGDGRERRRPASVGKSMSLKDMERGP